MQDLYISLNGNKAKLSLTDKGGFKTSTIEDLTGENLAVAASQISSAPLRKQRLNFIVGPEDLFFKFVTVTKSTENAEDQIIAEVKEKIEGVTLDDLYFSYQKIAPFVYQFVGMKKYALDNLMKIADASGIELNAVLPWPALLPRYVGVSESAIFVCNVDEKPTVILAELGGVFFVGTFDQEKSPEDLAKLVQDLSIYKRAKPIDRFYALNFPFFKDSTGFSVHNIEIPGSGGADTAGFETHLLANYMVNLVPNLSQSQINLVNLVPVPVVEKRNLPLVPVAASAGALLLVAAFVFGFTHFNKNKPSTGTDQSQVLGNKVQTSESTQSTQSETPLVQLNRADLKIRVENGSGVTGMAAQAKTFLEKLGYKIDSIDTADTGRDSTLLRFKIDFLKYKDMVIADTKSIYPSVVVENTLPASSAYDLLIVIGTSAKTQ
jgi:hypothetical protein